MSRVLCCRERVEAAAKANYEAVTGTPWASAPKLTAKLCRRASETIIAAADAAMFSDEAVERVAMALADSDGWKPEDLSKMTFGGEKTLREDYEKLAGVALAALKGDNS